MPDTSKSHRLIERRVLAVSSKRGPRFGAVGGLEGTLVNREHRLFEPSPTPIGALMCAMVIPPGPQWRAMMWSRSR